MKNQITPEEAINRLEAMQAQIIHGKNTFGECADVIRRILDERTAYKHSVVAVIGGTVDGNATHEGNYLQRLRDLVGNEQKVTLNISQIEELAEFAGLSIDNKSPSSTDDMETEITIERCPKQGIAEDDGTFSHYPYIAYFEEYPEEGAFPLGEKINENTDVTVTGRQGIVA